MLQERFQNFNINFNTANERNTVSSGDRLDGHILFQLMKETKITFIMLTVRGNVKIHWTSGTSKHRTHYVEEIELFKLQNVILQENNAVRTSIKLPPGNHLYPFTCQLPHGDFPSSFHGLNGDITYNMIVAIKRPWRVSKTFTTELNFVKHLDSNQPDLWSPLSGTNRITWWNLFCTSGPVSLKASMERKAFRLGETVKVMCDVSNASPRTATPKVTLQQKVIVSAQRTSSKRTHVKKLASVAGEPIQANVSHIHTEIQLTIPTTASLTISNCTMVNVDYMLEMRLAAKGSPDIIVLFPIVIYDSL